MVSVSITISPINCEQLTNPEGEHMKVRRLFGWVTNFIGLQIRTVIEFHMYYMKRCQTFSLSDPQVKALKSNQTRGKI